MASVAMANYALTPANVLASGFAVRDTGTLGAVLTAGQPVYRDATDRDAFGRGKLKAADANDTPATAAVAGILLNGGAPGQPAEIVIEDPDFAHGLAAVAAGDIIVVSATPGALAPAADLIGGNIPAVVSVATSATKAALRIVRGTAPIPA